MMHVNKHIDGMDKRLGQTSLRGPNILRGDNWAARVTFLAHLCMNEMSVGILCACACPDQSQTLYAAL